MRAWQQFKNIYHVAQAYFWRWWFGYPDRAVTIFGVTGTNGKTTTCYILGNILRAAHGESAVGMLTTVAFWVGAQEEINETKMTTMKSRTVFRYLARMRARGVRYVVVELTSHALDQHRVEGVTLAGAIITNLAREHLDYHRTMPAYAAAKAKVVTLLAPGAPLVGKQDDDLVARILRDATQRGVRVHRFTARDAAAVTTPLRGAINKENALAAQLLMRAAGVAEAAITQGIATTTAVPGRMDWLELPGDVTAVIDYAVTPDALERLYKEVRQRTSGNIFAVLGAAGLRDRGKRPEMAAAVARYADEVVLTREDPWTEDEAQIFKDLEEGLQGSAVTWQRIVDRREALRYCIEKARAGDIVVATGKGAERGMGIGKKIVPWNEREIILELAHAKK